MAAVAAAAPAPTTPRPAENAAGAAELSSVAEVHVQAAPTAGRHDSSPAARADVSDLLAALCRAVEELHALLCCVAYTNELVVARLCLNHGCHMSM